MVVLHCTSWLFSSSPLRGAVWTMCIVRHSALGLLPKATPQKPQRLGMEGRP